MKLWKNLLLQLAAQINQYVSAADQIHAGKRRILEQIMRGKYNGVPNLLVDAVLVVVQLKEPLQTFRRIGMSNSKNPSA